MCVKKAHKDHPVLDIEVAATLSKSDLKSYFENLVNITLPSTEKAHSEVTKCIEEYNGSVANVIKQSALRFHALREQIDTAEEEWNASFQEMFQKDVSVLMQKQEKLGDQIKDIIDLIKACHNRIAEAGDIATLEFNSARPNLDIFVPESFTNLPSRCQIAIAAQRETCW